MNVTDMRTLFTTKLQIENAKKVIEEYNTKGIIPQNDPEQLWAAQKIKDTILHPDTNEIIPLPFRVSAFVPANTLICLGMLLPGAGIWNQVFWQWINQSYNICLNHSNRNASNPMSNQELLGTYAAAVLTSCGVAVGFGRGAQKLPVSAGMKNIITMLVPFFSVSIAGIVNVFLMRRNEISQGINLKTEDGTVVGKSKIAGFSACKMVATSRIVTSIPVLTLVPFTLNALMQTQWLKARPHMVNVVNIALIIVALQTALPAAIALFPQTMRVSTDKLEPTFQNLKDPQGNKIQYLYYNRGL
uniref:Sidoreflexin n=1 Tax=Arcella intermedia TaxID=1963864 RepID=A0A6B2LBG6_9EUKA